jgi:acyl carrier protein
MRLEQVFADVFRRPEEAFSAESTPQTVTGWDSLKHIELVMAVEQAFKVRFGAAELATLRSLGQFRQLLLRKGVSA